MSVGGPDAPGVFWFMFGEAMNIDSAGSEISGGGEFDGRFTAFHADDGLDGAFTEAAFPDEQSAIVVLESGGADFAGGGGLAIDKDGDGNGVWDGCPLFGIPDTFFDGASLDGDDAAGIEEEV